MNTSDRIIKGFMEILKFEFFSDVTIDMISAECDIHRNTFYNHFEDKYELVDAMIKYNLNYIDFNNSNEEYFKKYPFEFLNINIHDDLKIICRKQRNDDKFVCESIKTIFSTINEIQSIQLIGAFEKVSSILLWYRYNDSMNNYQDDYVILDRIYRTNKFPNQ